VDNTGSELRIDANYTGTISGGGLEENLDERWQYNSVFATGQGGFFAENAVRSFNTRWTVGENQFRYENGRLQTVFRDGRPTEWDANNSPWAAEGTLLLNGQELGRLDMGQEGNFIKVWLRTGEQQIEVNSWRF
jgi:hypothetical protein